MPSIETSKEALLITTAKTLTGMVLLGLVSDLDSTTLCHNNVWRAGIDTWYLFSRSLMICVRVGFGNLDWAENDGVSQALLIVPIKAGGIVLP